MAKTLFAALFLAASILTAGPVAAADPTLHEVYQAANSGNLKQAEAMMDQVLRDHPNSAKAHYVYAELLAKQGRSAMAKAELATAERLAPGLPFAKPESVTELKGLLAPAAGAPALAASVAAVPVQRAADEFPWGLVAIGLLALAAFVFFIRSLMRSRAAAAGYGNAGYGNSYGAPAGYGAGGQTFGVPGAAPPGGGVGSGMMGGLATGLAMGAGVAAGEALMHRVLGGNDHQSSPAQQPLQSFDAAPTTVLPNDDMGGADFGVTDGGSWDDGGGSSGGGDDWS